MQSAAAQTTFARKEQKYLLSAGSYKRFMELAGSRFEADLFGHAAVSSLYYDTPQFDLISRSLEKPLYKEKLRVRSYASYQNGCAVPFSEQQPVFVELKKKFDGIVYKRRVPMSNRAAQLFMTGVPYNRAHQLYPLPLLQDDPARHESDAVNQQIAAELKATIERYPDLAPAMMVVVERLAFHAIEDSQLRITFDINPRYRTADLGFSAGLEGKPILPAGETIMEIKCANAYPAWLVHTLNDIAAYPQSCSKYGRAFELIRQEEEDPMPSLSDRQLQPTRSATCAPSQTANRNASILAA